MTVSLAKNYQCIVSARDIERLERKEKIVTNLFPYTLPVLVSYPRPGETKTQLVIDGHGIGMQLEDAKKNDSYWRDVPDFDIGKVNEVMILIPGTHDQYMVFTKKVVESDADKGTDR